jgi:hypothetical protein
VGPLAGREATRQTEFGWEGAGMSHSWATGTAFRRIELSVEQRDCPCCGSYMHVCCHRLRHLFTLDGPVELLLRLVHCLQKECPGQGRTYSPEAETAVAMPRWALGWDVFCWLGHRRFSRHWSVPTLRAELHDQWAIELSEDALEKHLRRYQTMVAARHSDLALLGQEYRDVGRVLLAIDGLQPEKGHETLYVVRELTQKRVWFAQALLSSASAEVRPLFVQARAWAEQLQVEVGGWMSDKQDAFVQGVAAVFPGVPHRFCENHFLRGLAQPMLEADSSAKVKLRRKVRGLRAIERQVLEQRARSPVETSQATARPAPAAEGIAVSGSSSALATAAPAVAERAPIGAVGGEPATAGLSVSGLVACEAAAAERVAAGSASAALATAALRAAEPAPTGAVGGEPTAAGLSASGLVASEAEAAERPATGSASWGLATAAPAVAEPATAGTVMIGGRQAGRDEPFQEQVNEVVLDYCAVVRGILNDDQGGPLKPPGLRMAEALGEVRASLERNLAAKKGGRRKTASTASGLY